MSLENPYAIHDDNQAAIHAPADARAVFLQKTYSLVFAGVLAFVATLVLAAPGLPLNGLAMSIGFGGMVSGLIYMGSFLVVKMLSTSPLGLPLFFAFCVFDGLITAPLVIAISGTENGADIIGGAGLITATLFTGLTAYVFKSGRDFTFLRGFLFTIAIGMFGVILAGWLFGFHPGIWFTYLGAGLMCGYILYDTSAIMTRYPTNAYVSAALNLFTDITYLFWYLLQILWSLNQD